MAPAGPTHRPPPCPFPSPSSFSSSHPSVFPSLPLSPFTLLPPLKPPFLHPSFILSIPPCFPSPPHSPPRFLSSLLSPSLPPLSPLSLTPSLSLHSLFFTPYLFPFSSFPSIPSPSSLAHLPGTWLCHLGHLSLGSWERKICPQPPESNKLRSEDTQPTGRIGGHKASTLEKASLAGLRPRWRKPGLKERGTKGHMLQTQESTARSSDSAKTHRK